MYNQNMNSKTTIINKIISWGLVALVFLLPLFFFPLTVDFFNFPKNILLYCSIALLLIAWAVKMLVGKTIKFARTPLDLPILLLGATFVFSTILVEPNKIDSLLTPGGTGTILALVLLYFLITNTKNSGAKLLTALRLSGAILGLLAVYQALGVGEVFAPWQFLKNRTFTPAGGALALATFLLLLLPISLLKNYLDLKTKKEENKGLVFFYLNFFVSFFLLAGLGIACWQLLTSARPTFLPYQSGWVIAIEAFKNSPFWGMGPGNFLSAFTQFKPVFFNQSDFWNLNFTNSSNYYLELLTTVGGLGLVAWLFLIYRMVKWSYGLMAKNNETIKQSSHLAILLILFLLLFIPVNFLLLLTLFILLASFSTPLRQGSEGVTSEVSWSQALAVIFTLLSGAILYFSGRALAAEIYYRNSLLAAAQNLGGQTYNLQIKAIGLNPYRESYRLSYSQTNLALANSLAAQENLSDQDRQTIIQLVQQAIREGKIAASLNPTSAFGWENLAQIYRSLINLAQGADQWTISAYSETIRLNPKQPRLRVDLGGVYFGLNDFENAKDQFKMAVSLKPDYANGWYNLAAAYRAEEKYLQAFQAMQQVVNILPEDNPDRQKAQNELEELRAQIPPPPEEATPSAVLEEITPQEKLATPSALPSPAISPVPLPEEAGPALPADRPEISPSPSPTPSPTPSPEVTPSPSPSPTPTP